MNGSAWFSEKFHIDKDELFVPLEDKGARSRWTQTLSFFETSPENKQVILNLGMNTHCSVPSMLSWLINKNGHLNSVESEINEFFVTINKKQIEIIKNLICNNFTVLAITDPPTQHSNNKISWMIPVFIAYELIAEKFLKQIGCKVLNIRSCFKDLALPEEYLSKEINNDGQIDWVHGSSAYYDWLAKIIKDQYINFKIN
jgi:hypothetical protein